MFVEYASQHQFIFSLRLGKAAAASELAAYDKRSDYDSHPVLARQQENRQQFVQSDSAAKNERMRQVDENLGKLINFDMSHR